MQLPAEFRCAFCGERNPITVALDGGLQQSPIEDCQVCCNPNLLFIRIDEATLAVEVDADCSS
ncbi:MAG: CPXCG motif-containing cysteine-rich protein [Cyanobacteria bacterium QS_8_64_29]|jgi:transcription elongation factor Elf1|nr:MAG: CPXCG motif-containing cysteine-rich protein [Cyanobacteria bacterium QS_8_64_29]